MRLLVRDDEQQALVAATRLAKHAKKLESLFVAVTAMLELERVLRSRYKFNKAEVIRALSSLMMTVELVFESEGPLEQALASYEDTVQQTMRTACTWPCLPGMTHCLF